MLTKDGEKIIGFGYQQFWCLDGWLCGLIVQVLANGKLKTYFKEC